MVDPKVLVWSRVFEFQLYKVNTKLKVFTISVYLVVLIFSYDHSPDSVYYKVNLSAFIQRLRSGIITNLSSFNLFAVKRYVRTASKNPGGK